MKYVAMVMGVVSWIALACLGVYGMAGFLQPEIFQRTADWVFAPLEGPEGSMEVYGGVRPAARIAAGCTGAGLLILDILWLGGAYTVLRKHHIEFETSKGKILVGLNALSEVLARTLMEDRNVRSAAVTILNAQKAGRPLRIHAQVEIYERGDLLSLQKYLQDLLEERFRDMLVIGRDVRYDVELVRIKPKAKDAKQGGDEELFHGPQYPVDL
ncbi:MAG: hypothetical protein V2A58_02325 [Planctomycetota bacterium]